MIYGIHTCTYVKWLFYCTSLRKIRNLQSSCFQAHGKGHGHPKVSIHKFDPTNFCRCKILQTSRTEHSITKQMNHPNCFKLIELHLVGGFNPLEKYARKVGSSPQVGVWIKQCFKPPSSHPILIKPNKDTSNFPPHVLNTTLSKARMSRATRVRRRRRKSLWLYHRTYHLTIIAISIGI